MSNAKSAPADATVDATSAAVSGISPGDWEPFPFEDIQEGEPDGKVHWLRQGSGGDGVLLTGMFTAQPCKVGYEFIGDESLHLMEGEITVEVEGGDQVELQPGDIASFPKGARSVWTIKSPMKKFFVISG
jgi:uncharacterized cupin superfamily protein